MRIDQTKCVACGNCVAICPMEAIYIDTRTRRATVNLDECVECYSCHRGMSMERLNPVAVRTIRRALALFRLRFDPEPDVCPTSAITPDELTWPRTVRRAFSDVTATHESTGIHGRGTEEVKTNDVTHRLGLGEVGLTVELGRPGLGVRFHDVQRVTQGLADAAVRFEQKNPVTSLMTDQATGSLNPDILREKVMSVIVEFSAPATDLPRVLQVLRRLAGEIETTMAVGVSVRCDRGGGTEVERMLADEHVEVVRAKTNLGLGRPDPVPATASSRGA